MKNFIKIISLVVVLVFSTTACEEADNVIDQVTDDVTSGAVLRTISLISNELPIGDDTASFSVEIEEQDELEGGLMESVDVYLKFADGSSDDGDSSAAITDEVFIKNIPASDFTTGPFNLPRTTYTITIAEMLAATNLTGDAIFGGDTFTTRLSLNLTDGRVFSVVNAGGIITGGFFNSPFQYITPVVCPVGEEEFLGDYTIVNNTPGVLGFNVFEEGGTMTLYIPEDATSVERAFDYVYLPDAGVGQGPVPFLMNYICDTVVIPANQGSGLQCSSGLTIGPSPNGDLGTYTTGDDSVVILRFTDNSDSDCGEGPLDVVATLTKQ